MTKDNGMDVSPSWQELRDEVDAAHAAKTKAEEAELSAAQELDEVKAERDALAANVEEYRSLVDELLAGYWNVEPSRLHAAVIGAEKLLDRESDTSLTRLKAEWQAEALERYSRIITEEWINNGENYGLRTASGQALLQAKELRRQASGDDS